MPEPVATATVTTMAARLGVEERTVRRAMSLAGVQVVAGTRGHYPVAEVEAAVREHANGDMIRGHATSGRGNVEGSQFDDFDGGSGRSTFGTVARAKLDEAVTRAEARRFDLDVKRGKYLPREDIMSAGADIIRRATFHFLRLPERAAPRLVGMTDPAAIAAVLGEETRASLAELSDLARVAEDIIG